MDAAFDGEGSIQPLLIGAILVVGVASAAQVAVNGQLGQLARSATVAGLVSFARAALVLGLLLAGMALGGDVPQLRPDPEWWLYTGGLMGVFVSGNSGSGGCGGKDLAMLAMTPQHDTPGAPARHWIPVAVAA